MDLDMDLNLKINIYLDIEIGIAGFIHSLLSAQMAPNPPPEVVSNKFGAVRF